MVNLTQSWTYQMCPVSIFQRRKLHFMRCWTILHGWGHGQYLPASDNRLPISYHHSQKVGQSVV